MINIFEAELEKGSGIPYILIKKNIIGASPEVDSILLDNIFDCKAYDPGCEGLRAEYLYSIVKNYKNKEKIYKEVLNAFNSMTETDFGEQQIFSFVCKLAEEKKAKKKILYDKMSWYIQNAKEDLFSMYDFVEKEGLKAAEFTARELGKMLEKHPGHSLYLSYGFFNSKEVLSFLQKSRDPHIKLYLNSIEKIEEVKPSKRKSATEIIEEYLKKNKTFHLLRHWLEKAKKPEIKEIVDFILQCKDKDFKYRQISYFDKVKFPAGYEVLKSEYLKAKKQDHKLSLLNAMLLFNKSEVKDMINDLDFDNTNVRELFIKALCTFYKKEENDLILYWLDSLDVYCCHDLIDFFVKNKSLKKDTQFYKKILYKLYHKNKCSLCREEIFDKLAENNFLEKTICQEAIYDCNKDIAKKAAQLCTS